MGDSVLNALVMRVKSNDILNTQIDKFLKCHNIGMITDILFALDEAAEMTLLRSA